MFPSLPYHQRKSNMKNVSFWPSHVIILILIVFFNMISISDHRTCIMIRSLKTKVYFNLPNVKQAYLPCGTQFY